MCGIFGIITTQKNENIYQIIINGLKQLQNRGYDSSGISVLENYNFVTNKYASTNNLSALDKLSQLNLVNDNKNNIVNIGIGHNRWATHGPKNDINAHPHLSNNENFVIVHNGIIENYSELKIFLIKNNFHFYSQTDTEVVVNLVEYYYNLDLNKYGINKINIESILKKVISKLQGTYGIILMHKNEPNKIYCTRNGSPLLIGTTDDYAIITSEQSGFCGLVNTYITLNNYDICTINYNSENNIIKVNTLNENEYTHKKINILDNELTPDPFLHWTLKEIYEQPKTIINSVNFGGRIKNNSEVKLGGLDNYYEILSKIENIILLGCGTSFHAGLYGMKFFKNICHFNTIQVFDGADFVYSDIPLNGKTAVILVSQSGETKDLHRCIQIAKENNLTTIGIINVIDSLIAREVDCGIYCNAGREIGVASTKAFTSQVICLSLLSIWFSQIQKVNENKRIQIIKDLRNLNHDFEMTINSLDEQIKKLCLNDNYVLNKSNNLFILGKGFDECIAKEGSLKIKEISYIHSEGYSASSLKHGPFALLDENFPVILLDLTSEHRSKILNCYEEINSRLAPIIFITNDEKCMIKDSQVIKIIYNNSYASLLGIIPLQLMAYYLSIQRGINPDIPKNLAKVVTVE
jgi:glucosamine--fructose-6-phosphate aminotransferase (isomerizing)